MRYRVFINYGDADGAGAKFLLELPLAAQRYDETSSALAGSAPDHKELLKLPSDGFFVTLLK
jgi:hypothetical protein